MSGRGFGGGYSGGPGGPGGPGDSNPSFGIQESSSSRTVPIYVLVLIMLGSGIFTLIFLWICVQYIYHRRRVRRAVGDLERMTGGAERDWNANGAEQTERQTTAPGASDLDSDVKRCEAGVELTYVVMAGEDQPTFLARPLNTSQEPPSSPRPVDAEVTVNSDKT